VLSYRLLRQAGRIGKNRYTVLCHIAGRLLGIRHVGHYFMAYGYAKWIDDNIDLPQLDTLKALAFLQRQAEVVAGDRQPSGFQEELGAGVGEFMRSDYGSALQKPWQGLMSTFDFDVRRRGRLLGRDELSRHVVTLGSSVLGICEVGFDCPGALGEELTEAASKVYIGSDMLLDLREDLRMGLVNIAAEDVEAYGISTDALREGAAGRALAEPGLGRWVAERAAELQGAADAVEPMLSKLRPWSLRVFMRKMSQKRREKLQRALDRCAAARGGGEAG